MSDGIDVSVLVTTYRRPRHLELVLASLARQECDGIPFEVVVSDDGSDDDTADVVARFASTAAFPVRFTTRPHDGFRLARVRNDAARRASGRYLMFLDGDCVVPPHHIAAHVARRRLGTALLGYCARLSEEVSVRLTPSSIATTTLGSLVSCSERRSLARRRRKARWHTILRHPTKPRLAGGDFGVWHEDFLRVNGFDERFVGWGQEDDDLGLRLRTVGIRLETILDRTCSMHVWHATDPTATPRWRDGTNVSYFKRRGRLTHCRHGLVDRPVEDIVWGLPTDLTATPLGRTVAQRLAAARIAKPGQTCEIDVVTRPGSSTFTRPAECRLVLIEAGAPIDDTLARAADQVVAVTSASDLDAALASVG